jgi:flagellar protein FliS
VPQAPPVSPPNATASVNTGAVALLFGAFKAGLQWRLNLYCDADVWAADTVVLLAQVAAGWADNKCIRSHSSAATSMFASSFANRTPHRQMGGGLYRQVGVETRLSGATPHQMVAMLFDGFMEAVAQARGAMRGGQPGAKGMAIGRAVRIVEEGLRAGLDLQAGGSLAQDLHNLYGYLTMRLTIANLHNNEEALDECQRLMEPLREAWAAIGTEAGA